MTDAVLVSVEDGIMVVTINRPEAKNSVNKAVAVGIAEAMEKLDSDPDIRAAILTGADNTFCAGMDLKAFVSGELPMVRGRGFAGLCEQPPRKPLIAAVEGYALAGGCELALSCDLIVVAENAKFGIPETKRGLAAAAGGLMRLPRQIPPRIAKELALTGEFISAQRAYELGLVNRIAAKGETLDGAMALARTIAANGPLAVMASKQVIDESQDWSTEEMFKKQASIIDPVFSSKDAIEGAKAFAEKRAPNWTGQ
ncbi:crotonase/enoyl-CoA hydratase family protein [Spongiibacter taiwanensis]|uniref:crotonase/enoyl-CoA hydratase family protein n=1 Tax=Spongiibacter taiwanensis TaxID=1748242 RepID=UPI002034CFCB|nr:crotonase/enoyl-CoA hydratase family protein [Spongiibacter taiwanensis]USA44029.1 crotonase/enoyl-CoA hydratase family protein [Spongiibacter taiwanensis]